MLWNRSPARSGTSSTRGLGRRGGGGRRVRGGVAVGAAQAGGEVGAAPAPGEQQREGGGHRGQARRTRSG